MKDSSSITFHFSSLCNINIPTTSPSLHHLTTFVILVESSKSVGKLQMNSWHVTGNPMPADQPHEQSPLQYHAGPSAPLHPQAPRRTRRLAADPAPMESLRAKALTSWLTADSGPALTACQLRSQFSGPLGPQQKQARDASCVSAKRLLFTFEQRTNDEAAHGAVTRIEHLSPNKVQADCSVGLINRFLCSAVPVSFQLVGISVLLPQVAP